MKYFLIQNYSKAFELERAFLAQGYQWKLIGSLSSRDLLRVKISGLHAVLVDKQTKILKPLSKEDFDTLARILPEFTELEKGPCRTLNLDAAKITQRGAYVLIEPPVGGERACLSASDLQFVLGYFYGPFNQD
jgi:hypothetical protein